VADDIIHAEVRPLVGKHYGTKVVVSHPSGKKFDIEIWMPIGSPSEQELAEWKVDRSMWEANVKVPDGWGGMEPIQVMFPTDNHYQSEFEAAVAKRIAAALDGWVLEETHPVDRSESTVWTKPVGNPAQQNGMCADNPPEACRD
jgi:hypothetical protein